MPSYFFVLALASAVFLFAYRPACILSEAKDFTRRRNLWLILTLAAFLSPNFWVYAFIAASLLIHTNKSESNPVALFFFMLFVVPDGYAQIPGIGFLEHLFQLSHPRLLSLFILLPAFFFLRRQNDTVPFGRLWPDRALLAFLLLNVVLYARDTSVTNTIRYAFYHFLGTFLPYFVISRSLKNLLVFRDALLSLVVAIMLLAIMAIFEFGKFWLLYRDMLDTLGLNEEMTFYIIRDGMLRVTAAAGHPITLGFIIVVGIGLYLFLQRSIPKKLTRLLGLMLLVGGLIATLSRGPWMGAAALLLFFLATGRNPVRRLLVSGFAAILIFALLAVLPGGERFINLLPYIGTVEQHNIEYRERLITNSMIVIQQNPWFGSVTYLETPEMEAMRQGEGIIDVTNSYLGIALEFGIVGLGLFVGFFILVVLMIYQAMRQISDKGSEEYLLGQSLLATLLAILFVITTVSSILNTALVYWSVAGIGVAYAQMILKTRAGNDRPGTALHPLTL
jgi:O-antigen ligase